MAKTKFGKSLLSEAKREGKHCWRNYQCNPPASKAITDNNKAKQFSVEGAMDRICKKVRKGKTPAYCGNRRIA